MRQDHVLSDNTSSFSIALTKLHLQNHTRRINSTKTHFLSKDLLVFECVIATLLGTNVMPQARGGSERRFSHDHEENCRRKKKDSIDDEEEEEEAIVEGGPTTALQPSHEDS
ncbi:hypothetical protein M9H77_06145 [Catharanthus roseus]|uniref:Uncharacterized protein n=1 Tax=Catharanthus roseus TaxID=4058 RepID=A0ACC0BRF0_CATRO|nr:hypothetical protein M9H77_06145 [Catharanthus roseus]